MYAGKVIGRVVATRKYETLKGIKFLLVQPLTWDKKPDGEPLVALDSVGAGAGEFVFFVKAREACFPFLKQEEQVLEEMPPTDATIVGIIDGVNLKKDRR